MKYRVFYDGAGKHLVVFRNGVQTDDWNFGPIVDQPIVPHRTVRDYRAYYFCFSRGPLENRPQHLNISHLEAKPWNGAIPAGDAALAGRPASSRHRGNIAKES